MPDDLSNSGELRDNRKTTMGKDNEASQELIVEEQRILDCLIRKLDSEALAAQKDLSEARLKKLKADSSNLAETYAQLVRVNDDIHMSVNDLKKAMITRDALYDDRLVLFDNADQNELDLKVGLHSFISSNGDLLVCSWKNPICREFILNDELTRYKSVVSDSYTGEKQVHDYTLRLNRKIKICFDKVKNVTIKFPLSSEERQKIITDEFLQELLSRREENAFQNIVFSIQRKQANIVKRPFRENLIVQGCAGSGKSMIMMHRLPILIYDQGNGFARKSIYIITPSETYINMAYKMRVELEISDLNMGTMKDYYDYVLGKYRVESNAYGKMSSTPLSASEEKYAYSRDCRVEIYNEISEKTTHYESELQQLAEKMDVKINPSRGTAESDVNRFFAAATSIQTANSNILNQYLARIRDIRRALKSLKDYSRTKKDEKIEQLKSFLYAYVPDAVVTANGRIAEYLQIHAEIETARRQNRKAMISKHKKQAINPSNNNLTCWENYWAHAEVMDQVYEAGRRQYCRQDLDLYEKCPERWDEKHNSTMGMYASIVMNIGDDILSGVENSIQASAEEKYAVVEQYKDLVITCNNFVGLVNEILLRGSYEEQLELDRILMGFKNINFASPAEGKYLAYEECVKVNEIADYYRKLSSTIVRDVYIDTLKRMGRKVFLDANGGPGRTAVSCSPYLYLQIVYQYRGVNPVSQETLIAIDEAQNLAPEELYLLSAVNGDQCVFNLYGDVHQHIENTKGVDNWDQFDFPFEQYTLNENYRNAKQITEFYNQRFSMNMQPIALTGRGVHSNYKDLDGMDMQMEYIYIRPLREGLSAIIVKDPEEAAFFKNRYPRSVGKVNDMTLPGDVPAEIMDNRWNLITVEQAKGLEFNTVIAVTGNMTNNEKYICCTRALDELFLFDFAFTVEKKNSQKKEAKAHGQQAAATSKDSGVSEAKGSDPVRTSPVSSEDASDNAGKNEDRKESDLKAFFLSKGLKVKDDRPMGGFLYVFGTREQISWAIVEAQQKFRVSGGYYPVNIGIEKHAWCTTSKK